MLGEKARESEKNRDTEYGRTCGLEEWGGHESECRRIDVPQFCPKTLMFLLR